MGFFSDLKEDLSQAVNELMPEETLDAAMTDGLETEQVLPEEEFVQETPVTEEAQDTVSSLDISSMLDRLDEVEHRRRCRKRQKSLQRNRWKRIYSAW